MIFFVCLFGWFLRFGLFFLLLLRRGDRLARRAVTFFFGQKKKLTKEKLPKCGDGLDARASGLRYRFATLVLTPWRRYISKCLRMPEIWDIGAPTASRPAGWAFGRIHACLFPQKTGRGAYSPNNAAVIIRVAYIFIMN